MIKELKAFVMRGSVLDLAVGIIIGAAFTTVVKSLVDDILMPPIGMLLGGVDFSNLFISLDGTSYDSLTMAQEAGAATLNYGVFINTVLDFIQMNRLRAPKEEEAPAAPTTRECPYCRMEVALAASRCPHCTSELEAAA